MIFRIYSQLFNAVKALTFGQQVSGRYLHWRYVIQCGRQKDSGATNHRHSPGSLRFAKRCIAQVKST